MTSPLSKRNSLILLTTILAIGFLWRLWFSWRDYELIVSFPLIDDSFYALNIARNIALGNGMTHDGVNITNGFQPLFVFLAVPVYFFTHGDKILSINIILTLSAIVSYFTALLTFKITRHLTSKKAAFFAVFFWTLSPTVMEHEINGLETGLAIFFLAWTTWYYLSRIRSSIPEREGLPESQHENSGLQSSMSESEIFAVPAYQKAGGKQYAVLGLFCGLAILSRIDNGILLIALTLDILVKNIRSGIEPKRYIKNLAIFGVVCGIVISPWFLSNLFNFGAIMPDSGQAVRFLSMSPRASNYSAASENLKLNSIPFGFYLNNIKIACTKLNRTPFLQTAMWLGLLLSMPWLGLLLSFAVAGGIALFLLVYRKSLAEYIRRMPKLADANWLILYSVLIVAGYTLYVFCQWFYPRYFFPITWISIIYSAVFIDFLTESRFIKHGGKITILIGIFFLTIFSVRTLEKVLERGEVNRYYDVAIWGNQNLSDNVVLGMFQSGTTSYFANQTVINLDGVVNSGAFKAMRDNRMMSYLISQGIEYIIDWEWMVDDYLRDYSDRALVERTLKLIKEDVVRGDRFGDVNVYKIENIPQKND
jgi:hypothetical protein